ncbi:ribonuclease HII [Cellulosilyticum sp. I15G10I2]|uniref:ribonuclease HII n=1 Tax=Cellulosilyticum sp. I15G10I2 TaxID=1892843 RepID=UPI00085C5DC2|nr:ribonuclease HII [Cellulosilyticum sp. I15G10I2]
MKISEIDNILKKLDIEALKEQMVSFKEDHRVGVQKLLVKYQNKLIQHYKQREEWALKCRFDQNIHQNKHVLVGVDEVGRGPLAGPVVAAAVILPYDTCLLGLKDSKKMSPLKREELYIKIQEIALAVGIGIIDANRIDQVNILNATFEAMQSALLHLNQAYDVIGVDGDKTIPNIAALQHAIIGGDDKSASIAAASVIAKVTRDRMMHQYAKAHDVYDWINNKGYGSSKHYEGIRKYGITPLHRKSFLKNEGIF